MSLSGGGVSTTAHDADSGPEMKGEEQRRPDHVPPVDDRADLRVVLAPRRIGLRDGHFAHPIPKRDRLPMDVVLELVPIEPRLVDAHPGVVEEREPVRAEAIRDVGPVESGEDAEHERVLKEIAARLGFDLVSHRLALFGRRRETER